MALAKTLDSIGSDPKPEARGSCSVVKQKTEARALFPQSSSQSSISKKRSISLAGPEPTERKKHLEEPRVH